MEIEPTVYDIKDVYDGQWTTDEYANLLSTFFD